MTFVSVRLSVRFIKTEKNLAIFLITKMLYFVILWYPKVVDITSASLWYIIYLRKGQHEVNTIKQYLPYKANVNACMTWVRQSRYTFNHINGYWLICFHFDDNIDYSLTNQYSSLYHLSQRRWVDQPMKHMNNQISLIWNGIADSVSGKYRRAPQQQYWERLNVSLHVLTILLNAVLNSFQSTRAFPC